MTRLGHGAAKTGLWTGAVGSKRDGERRRCRIAKLSAVCSRDGVQLAAILAFHYACAELAGAATFSRLPCWRDVRCCCLACGVNHRASALFDLRLPVPLSALRTTTAYRVSRLLLRRGFAHFTGALCGAYIAALRLFIRLYLLANFFCAVESRDDGTWTFCCLLALSSPYCACVAGSVCSLVSVTMPCNALLDRVPSALKCSE